MNLRVNDVGHVRDGRDIKEKVKKCNHILIFKIKIFLSIAWSGKIPQ